MPEPLRDVIARHGLQASKALGQNFILDRQLLARIAAVPGSLDGAKVYEVGPGPGGLTRALLDAGANVVAVERDRRCLPALAELEADFPGKLRIISGDALKVGDFTLDATGIGFMEGAFAGIDRYDYNLFVVVARPDGAEGGGIPASVSIAGSFTIIDDITGTLPGDSRPGSLPQTGEAPAEGGINRWQAAFYAMAATGLAIIVVNTLRKRRRQS